jgi:cytochrome c5
MKKYSAAYACIAAVVLLAQPSCARRPLPSPPANAGSIVSPAAAVSADNQEGARLLQAACTACHDLGGLPAFQNAYGEKEWRSLVETMVSYGAKLTETQVNTVVRHLAANY